MAIQHTTPFSISGPGITAETDAYAAATQYHLDANTSTLTVVLQTGTATTASSKTTSFTPGILAPGPVTMQFSLVSNTWTSSNGLSGSLTAAQITAVQTIVDGIKTAIRNPAESFALSAGVFAGTAIPW